MRLVPVTTVVRDLQAPPRRRRRRLPAAAPALAPPRAPARGQPRRRLRRAARTSRGRAPGPVAPERLEALRLASAPAGGHLGVFGVDKFPRMTDYVVPVRRADRRRRPRAPRRAPGRGHDGHARGLRELQRRHARHLDGRGAHQRRRRRRRRQSDVGGGASIMGTLSGGGARGHRGRRATACWARTPAWASRSATAASSRPASTSRPARGSRLPDGSVVKARELSGASDLLFRRNSVDGAVEAGPRSGRWGGLNAALHANR